MPTTARLIAEGGPEDGREYPLDRRVVTLGRQVTHTVPVVWDASVSRKDHAQIFCSGGLYWLEDMGSRNGTFLALPGADEQRLPRDKPVLLLDGARLRAGSGARFLVAGVAASQNQAVQLLLHTIDELRLGVPHLPADALGLWQKRLRALEPRLLEAKDEDELLRLAADEIAAVSGEQGQQDAWVLPPAPAPNVLPPLPTDLPDPGEPGRLTGLQSILVASLRACIGKAQEGTGDE